MRCYGYSYIGYNNNVSDSGIIIQGKNMEEVKMINYLKRTWKNKVTALLLLAIGYIATTIDNDGTILAFMVIVSLPMLFIDENLIK